jgi:Kef-type K+ transport system membrane component KefB
VALAGFAIPFSLALAAAWVAPYSLGCELDADPRVFAFFLATAISISALPVIAKTLMDLGLYRSDLGMVSIAAAVFNDLVGWLVFAVILGMLGTAAPHGWGIAGTIVLTVAFAVLVLTAGRWAVDRVLPWIGAYTTWPGGVLGFAIALALLAAALTEWIGVHAIFGAFLVGVAIGDSSHLRDETRRTILDFVSFIFAPLFFASVGLHIDFAAKFYPSIVVTILLIACAGKILGCGLTARWSGMDWNSAWAVGFAMNARGAMEIILGMLALQNGLIRQRMFVALVVMALVTSMISGPAIQRLLGRRRGRQLGDYLAPRGHVGALRAGDWPAAVVELLRPLEIQGLVHPKDSAALAESADPRGVLRQGELAIVRVVHGAVGQTWFTVGSSAAGLQIGEGAPARLVCLVFAPDHESAAAAALEADIAATLTEADVVRAAAQAATATEFLAALRTRRPAAPARAAVGV